MYITCQHVNSMQRTHLSTNLFNTYMYIVYLQQSESKKIYIITRNNNIVVNILDTVALHNSELLTL